jgi:hypothetical protein
VKDELRLSTTALLMEGARLADEGTHEKLLRASGDGPRRRRPAWRTGQKLDSGNGRGSGAAAEGAGGIACVGVAAGTERS